MTLQILKLNHVNITVPAAREAAARHFYGVVLGLQQIPKPDGPRKNLGAWFEIGSTQLHLSLAEGADNSASDAHVCYEVPDIAGAKSHLQRSGVEILKDESDTGTRRFFVRDPGGNMIEVAQVSEATGEAPR
jgi:catechol 2,3-dioxygenase-like lactoylglutathione lyase family enzyme